MLSRILNLHRSLMYLQQLKQQRDQMKIYQKKINIQLEKDRVTAKKALSSGNKQYDQ